MRVRGVVFLAVALMASLAGCKTTTAGSAASAATTAATSTSTAVVPTQMTIPSAPSPTADDYGLVAAQYPQCNLGSKILRYLQTGDNGGDPGMDEVFASYVGVPAPQARALADQWIESCDQKYAQQEAAASSSAAAVASQAAASQAAAAETAANQRACETIGGRYNDGGWIPDCLSTVPGDPSGIQDADCDKTLLDFPITDAELADVHQNYPGCFK